MTDPAASQDVSPTTVAEAEAAAEAEAEAGPAGPVGSRNEEPHPGAVRSSDLEPYTGLRWVSLLFKAAAIFVFIALAAEFVAGLRLAGTEALPALLGETVRTLVLAVVLWAGGDLVRLLVDMGHDLRAQRILLVRLLSRTPKRTLPDGRTDERPDYEAEELNVPGDRGRG